MEKIDYHSVELLKDKLIKYQFHYHWYNANVLQWGCNAKELPSTYCSWL